MAKSANIQFIVDRAGHKIAVLIPIEIYKELKRDLDDLNDKTEPPSPPNRQQLSLPFFENQS